MKELRQGVKLKKVQDQEFDPLPTEFSLTPFEMLMQDIRTRKFQLRKVMVSWVLILIRKLLINGSSSYFSCIYVPDLIHVPSVGGW